MMPRADPNAANRSIYFGGVPEDLTEKDLCDAIRGGLIDNVKVLPEKKCAFVSFVEPRAAAIFVQRASATEFIVKGKPIKVGWGKPRPFSPDLARQVQMNNATRNVYLGNISADVTESKLREDFGRFGQIEKIDILPAKKLAFTNFTNLLSAVKCVEELKYPSSELAQKCYSEFKCSYGKDRCAQDGFIGQRGGQQQYGGRGGGYQQMGQQSGQGNYRPYSQPQQHQQPQQYMAGSNGYPPQGYQHGY
jgi:RNA recognition motif-containing protein